MSEPSTAPAPLPSALVRKHLRVGWWALLVFLTLGIGLETLHGLKVLWYLDENHATRRLMFTLAHSHGALLALVNLAFALTLRHLPAWNDKPRTLASRCLLGALVLLPGGFFLGGFFIHGGDPGLGIVLVPPGALLLLVAVLLTARAATGAGGEEASD